MLIEKPRIPFREILLFGLWPCFIKKLLYRLRGYKIGRGVRIGFGSVLCGERVEVGEHTTIGFLTILRGREILLGPCVQIGSTSFLDTPYISIGEGTKINEQVFVGGLQFPDSKFSLGRNCQVMQSTFINPAKGVEVGDDSGIGGHCLIFGHSSWLSQLEGYAVDFAPVVIGKSVSLSWRVFVLPGAQIGDGAVVGGDSLVKGTIPPRCLAVGFPARVISRAPDYPKELSETEKRDLFAGIVTEMLKYFQDSGFLCKQEGRRYAIRTPSRGWTGGRRQWALEVTCGGDEAVSNPGRGNCDVFLSLPPVPPESRRELDGRRIVWIDIARKERSRHTNDLGDEVLLFLRRYGIRTLRAGGDAAI